MNRDQVFAFMRDEVQKLPPDRQLYFAPSGDAMLCCPYHSGGMEKTPSFKVTLDPTAPVPPGFCWCWSCKQKHPWNDFAELFGLGKVSESSIKRASANDSYLKKYNFDLEEAMVPDLTKLAPWPTEVPWRTIPGKTVVRYGGRSIMFGRQPFLYLPVMVHGEQVGGINCKLNRTGAKHEKAYINTFGNWSLDNLFGFDVAARQEGKPLWVVEGPRDCTWLRACGARAVSLIGSAVSPRKLQLIRDLDPPCVLIATDPDDAGEHAADLLLAAFNKELPTVQYPFKPGQDPAELSYATIKRTIAKLEQLR